MKVLGLSFGRKMKCCELLVKEALMGAEKAGAEVSFISMMDLDIKHCKGCGACGAGMRMGKQIKCVIMDDYDFVEQALLDTDAVIVAAPVYALAPTGQFKNFLDRFGPAHDRMALEAEREKRKAAGAEPLDPRVLKERYVGYISVGGASTQNWVSLGLPSMQLFGFSTLMKVVDQIDAYDMGRKGSPLLDTELMNRVNLLGENVGAAIGKDPGTLEWKGDDEGTCPVCHCNILTVGKTTTVECPICGISGKISIDNDVISVNFSQEEQNRARSTRTGLLEHYLEIANMPKAAVPKLEAAKDVLPGLLKKYEGYKEAVKK